ncbi:CRISPR-associated protein Cas2 [Oribacterium sp. KHPX15]|uniref:CRISPR-associated endonuclease Cas2 n=1 Tax=Oribacterium sp. KHPX15 TaxID=1855342 RepID=UPI0008974053|nr:CRISPR-associated endonuclease Cas2 [Oribacterium sp. KHPX15]SDZ88705.1 CRISPR-associated protein Cas2 [Oribacterium sp. KHPX15]
MRLLVMFDLPMETASQRREYRKFRKYLIKQGVFMLQESNYCKMVPNSSAGEFIVEGLRSNKPPEGSVQILKITEKQFAKMEYLVGHSINNVINDDRRLVIL